MRGRAGVGAEATGVGGMEATDGEALGLVSASASGHSGGRIGGPMHIPMAIPMLTPMATRRSSPCHPPKSMCNPLHRLPPSLLHRPLGITVTTHGGITPTCSNVQEDGGQYPPRRHRPQVLTQVCDDTGISSDYSPPGDRYVVTLPQEGSEQVVGTNWKNILDGGAAWGVWWAT
jgi:hypothetical protein